MSPPKDTPYPYSKIVSYNNITRNATFQQTQKKRYRQQDNIPTISFWKKLLIAT